jgi:hypothetical protein
MDEDEEDMEVGESKKLVDAKDDRDDAPHSSDTPTEPNDSAPAIKPATKPGHEQPKEKAATPGSEVAHVFSDPCAPGSEPYRRLILISSRIPGAKDIASAALNDCAVGVYDWKHFTLEELLGRVKSMLGGHKVDSVAVIAPGDKPGAIGLLQGYQTTRDKLSKKEDLAQFWKRLASHVTPNSGADGATGRVDLLSCRVTEAAEKGANMMASLQKLTKLQVFASDDARREYPLGQRSKTGGEISVTPPRLRCNECLRGGGCGWTEGERGEA